MGGRCLFRLIRADTPQNANKKVKRQLFQRRIANSQSSISSPFQFSIKIFTLHLIRQDEGMEPGSTSHLRKRASPSQEVNFLLSPH